MSKNSELLQNLTSGTEISFYPDMSAVQTDQNGLLIAAGFVVLVIIYLLLTQLGFLGGAKKTFVTWVCIGIAAIVAYFLYDKYQGYKSLDSGTPLLTLNRQYISYEKDHSIISWDTVESIEHYTENRVTKQASSATTFEEVRIKRKDGSFVAIDHAPLNVGAQELATALENYRKGL